jgi:predicted nucleic acid-binding protein
MIVLETSAVIDLLSGNQLGLKVKDHIAGEPAAITSLSAFEVLSGRKGTRKTQAQEFIKNCEILSFDEKAVFAAIELEEDQAAKGKPIGKLDTMIAATSRVHKLQLLATDGDFKDISGCIVLQ